MIGTKPKITRTPPRLAAQRKTAKSITLPAPVGGWNARDSIAKMAPTDAVEMVNYWPNTTTVDLRLGYTEYVADATGQVETLMVYNGGTTSRMFIATENDIYQTAVADDLLIDESGNVLTAENGDGLLVETAQQTSVSGLTNGRWQYVNFTTPGGSYLCAVNGADYYRVYNGSSWAKDTDGAPYDITGVDSRTLVGINVFKYRLWFVQTGTLKAWYLPVNSIGGAAASLDMSSLCSRGGYLMAMGTWTLDAGYGVDDYAVWITSEGEVLVWRMTDPTDPNSIFLVGVYYMGSPIGRRCMEKFKGDLLIICQEGLVPLSRGLQSSRLDPRVALTDKIQKAISESIALYGSNFGWQTIAFPKENMLILNVPTQEGQSQQQYVMNTITGAWGGPFTGWEANCWALFEDELYFGGNNQVGHAWDGYDDLGEAISGSVLQAFNYFGSPGMLKRFTMMRPTFYCNGAPEIQGNINVDFDQSAPESNLNTVPIVGALFDVSQFDAAQFAPDPALANRWQGANGVGYCGAVRLASSTSGFTIQLVSTEVVVEGGAIL